MNACHNRSCVVCRVPCVVCRVCSDIFSACSSGLQEVNPQAFYLNYQETLEGFVTTSVVPKLVGLPVPLATRHLLAPLVFGSTCCIAMQEKAIAKSTADKEIMDETVLAEFKSGWEKHQLLVRHLVKMFLYLVRIALIRIRRYATDSYLHALVFCTRRIDARYYQNSVCYR